MQSRYTLPWGMLSCYLPCLEVMPRNVSSWDKRRITRKTNLVCFMFAKNSFRRLRFFVFFVIILLISFDMFPHWRTWLILQRMFCTKVLTTGFKNVVVIHSFGNSFDFLFFSVFFTVCSTDFLFNVSYTCRSINLQSALQTDYKNFISVLCLSVT